MAEETTTSPYKVRAGAFEGPLDLLLSLIEQRKLFVNDLSLAEVTNDYVAYIKTLGDMPAEKRIADVSYFIVVAATLILIKSRSLLPNLLLTTDEEEKISDLEERLRLYKIIKDAAIGIKNNFGAKIIFFPLERNWNEPLFSPDPAITVQSMGQSIMEVINNLPKPAEKLPEVEVKRIINIDEIISSLTARIENAVNLSFREFSKSHNAKDSAEEKVHVIVSFLAMLELVREGLINVIQNSSFEDIEITKEIKEDGQNTIAI